ncbi:hypothetical protein [Acetobacter senegalensis]|uniref:hypothetical protein n=1 Tax=Acetobacter senegalensis TaxID=446692 RepID=UPI00128C4566|nr:hypothetical protein [Acetobacter senegalensis]MCG4257704.1 hypothetical protein [Acetobacter senegalensis]MCG4267770.1 hypothetical protein [Acetobacter senegalensis]MPQ74780.1 hypothetical protein [Acetobacter senegalensis]
MAICPGAQKATNANQVIINDHYCMWLNLDPKNGIPVKILGWQKTGRPGVFINAPSQLLGMDPTYILLVEDISTGATLTITDDPANGGAVYYGMERATFHKI